MSFYQKQSDKIGIEQRGKVLSEIWFPTILHFCDINDYENLNKTWLREILKWRTNDQKGIVRSNARGWHSAVDMHMRKPFINMGVEFLRYQKGNYLYTEYDGIFVFFDNFKIKNNCYYYTKKIEATNVGLLYDLILDGDYFKVSSSSQFDIFKKNKKLISINSDKVRLFV